MEIETERLLLRPWREEDAPALYRYAKDPAVGPAAGWSPHTDVENSRQIIRTVLSAPETYAVVLKETGEPVGSVGIMPPRAELATNTEQEAEIGYWIGVPYWGRGLIPEAVRALQRRCFENLGCKAVWCGYFDGNRKSKRVQEKCGFRFHHSQADAPCGIPGLTRTEHFTYLTKAQWEACSVAAVPLERLSGVAPLFGKQMNTMVLSCLQGIMGTVYAPWDTPGSAAAVLGDFCFLAGRPDERLVTKDYHRGFLLMVPLSEGWASLIEELYPLSLPRKRFAFRKEANFDQEKLKALTGALPPGCRLRQIDAECYRKCLSRPWSRDLVGNFPTWEEYKRLGLGFVILQGEEILSGASAYSRCREGIEIEIDTREDHRRQGLAAACASALILRCLEMDLFPGWDAHNPASAALAEKLGYIPAGCYTAYEVVPQKSSGLRIVSLGQHPERIRDAARWFSGKWDVPEGAYLESMEAARITQTGVPAWYEMQNRQGQRIAGLGVIENDFHKRPDLTPNLCALYVEESCRKRGLARALLNHACRELHRRGIQDAYLITSHTCFYEKCGWEYLGDIEENDGGQIRMYHRSTADR